MNNFKKIGLGILMPAALLFTACSRTPKTYSLTVNVIESKMKAFHNIVLDITNEDMKKAGFEYGDIVNVKVEKDDYKPKEYTLAYVTNYNEAGSFGKSLCDYEAKGDKLNISPGLDNEIPDDCFEGGKCTITMKQKQGYTETRNIAQVTTKLSYDECGRNNSKYANARDVIQIAEIGENIKHGLLYRGSTPFNFNKNIDRYDVADHIMEYFKVNSEISISFDDNFNKLDSIFSNEKIKSGNYSKKLYKASVRDEESKKEWVDDSERTFFTINLGNDFFDKDGGAKNIKRIFTYMIERIKAHPAEDINHPIFYIHCDEGKDRTGFIIMLLEALMGVQYEDLVADFMETFLNYYNISKVNNLEKYNTMANLTCYRNLYSFLMKVDNEKDRIKNLAAIDLYHFNAKEECDKIIKDEGPAFVQQQAENYLVKLLEIPQDDVNIMMDFFSYQQPNFIK